MIQNIVEIVFFFNIPVLWLSKSIREEREYCCDAMAVYITKNKKAYIQALVSFHEFDKYENNYELTFPGKKQYLLKRVQRIIHESNKKITFMKKISFFLLILCTGFVAISFTKAKKQFDITKEKILIQNVPSDISPKKHNISDIEIKIVPIDEKFINSKKPLKNSSFKKDQINTFKQPSGILNDTIPKNASKDYIEGYKAGMKYKNESMSDSNESYILKEKIEQLKLQTVGNTDKKKDKLMYKFQRENLESLKSKAEYYKDQVKFKKELMLYSDTLKYDNTNLDLLKQKTLYIESLKENLINEKTEKNKKMKWENEKIKPGHPVKKFQQ